MNQQHENIPHGTKLVRFERFIQGKDTGGHVKIRICTSHTSPKPLHLKVKCQMADQQNV